MHRKTLLLNMYGAMQDTLGTTSWWPTDAPFEVAIGLILSRNATWKNVSNALLNLKNSGLFTPKKMYALADKDLAELIRPAGCFRLKTDRIRHFLTFLRISCHFTLEDLKAQEMQALRTQLLAVKGIGPETADSILLYALDKPSFVVDAPTARILNRHYLIPEDASYEEVRDYFMDVLDPDMHVFREFHALLVQVGKRWCKKKTGLCETCPLVNFLE